MAGEARTDSLTLTIAATHRALGARLRDATSGTTLTGQPRIGFARTDTFMAATSRHLAAVDEVLLPLVRRHVPHGRERVHDYLHQARRLERALSLLKARLYGEAHAVYLPWPRVWADVRRQLARHNRMERALVHDLLPELDEEEVATLAQRVYRCETRAPTRPHPYTPHTGVVGRMARKLWAVADRFWDTAEGRMIPEPVRPRRHHHDSLVAQYLLGTPHFDEKASILEHRRQAGGSR